MWMSEGRKSLPSKGPGVKHAWNVEKAARATWPRMEELGDNGVGG